MGSFSQVSFWHRVSWMVNYLWKGWLLLFLWKRMVRNGIVSFGGVFLKITEATLDEPTRPTY